MIDSDTLAKSLGLLLACAAVGLIIFLILRELMCWYYKINRIVSLLEDIKGALSQGGKTARGGRGARQSGRTADGTTPGLGSEETVSGSTQDTLGEEPGEVDTKSATGLFNRGVDLLENGKPGEAIELFNEALEAEPQDSETWFWKGECLLRLGSHQEALACFERAAAFNSTDPKPLYGKARALDELGHTEKAAKFYSGYLAKAPEDDEWTDVARRRLKEIERTAGH